MSLYRRKGSDKWWVSIYIGSGRPRLRRSTGRTDRADAELVAAAWERAARGDIDRDRLVGIIDALLGQRPSAMRVSLAAAWSIYTAMPDVALSPMMLSIRAGHVKRFVAWVQGRYPRVEQVDEVTRDIAMQYAEDLRPACKTPKTYNDHRSDLRTVWQTLRYRAGLAENVWDIVPRAKGRGRTGRAFTRAEIARLLAVCRAQDASGEWYGATMVALYTGLRQGDVAALSREQCLGDTIHLKPSKTARHGTRVAIPLHPALLELLAALPPHGPLFPRLAAHGVERRREYAAILQAAGLCGGDAKISFHCLRHTWRTWLAEAGVPGEVARRMGGWTTDIDQARYNHDLSQERAAIDRLPTVKPEAMD